MDCENGTSRIKSENSAIAETLAYKRLEALFDDGFYTEIDRFAKNGETGCGVVAAFGNVNGCGVYAYSQDVEVCSGAMGRAQAAKISKVYELALKNGSPVVAIFDSKGAFAGEETDAVNAYGDLIALSAKLSGVVPQIAIVAGTCVGSAAILASLSDFTVMSKDSSLCINSAFITGNADVGSANTAAQNGTAAIVTENDIEAVSKAVEILSFLPANNLSVPPVTDYIPATVSGDGVNTYISGLVDAESFVELSAGFGKCAKVGFARIGGSSVGIIATDSSVNDALLCGKGAAKISRFVRLCDAYSIPVVTLLDCAGFSDDADGELSGTVKSVASLTSAYAEATTAKVAVITGKAYGAAYASMAGSASGSDYVIALVDAEVCALSPATAVQFLYKDRLGNEKREDIEKEYRLTVGSPFKAAENGAVNDVITSDKLSEKVISALDMLASKRVSTLDKKHSNMPF